jgi:hypothetical protein
VRILVVISIVVGSLIVIGVAAGILIARHHRQERLVGKPGWSRGDVITFVGVVLGTALAATALINDLLSEDDSTILKGSSEDHVPPTPLPSGSSGPATSSTHDSGPTRVYELNLSLAENEFFVGADLDTGTIASMATESIDLDVSNGRLHVPSGRVIGLPDPNLVDATDAANNLAVCDSEDTQPDTMGAISVGDLREGQVLCLSTDLDGTAAVVVAKATRSVNEQPLVLQVALWS